MHSALCSSDGGYDYDYDMIRFRYILWTVGLLSHKQAICCTFSWQTCAWAGRPEREINWMGGSY